MVGSPTLLYFKKNLRFHNVRFNDIFMKINRNELRILEFFNNSTLYYLKDGCNSVWLQFHVYRKNGLVTARIAQN